MTGILRWRDIQNINTTEDQINLLAGLTAIAADINRITGYIYSGTDLNNVVETFPTMGTHIGSEILGAHTFLPHSIDGGVISYGTLDKNRLAFTALDDIDLMELNNQISSNDADVLSLRAEVNTLYGIVLPGQANDIAESIAQMVEHVEKLKDAHDATAISFGNQYDSTLDSPIGSSQTMVSLDDIRFFQIGDTISLQDLGTGPEDNVINDINYNTGHIAFATPTVGEYRIADSFIIHNRTQDNVQESLHRSLRNTTDNFVGRLTIDQSTTDDALVINKINTGYLARFNNFTSKTDQDFSIELGENDGSSLFRIANSDDRLAFSVLDDGSVWLSDITFEDRISGEVGAMSHQPLTDTQAWVLPDRSGYLGVGDVTFSELLKVSLNVGTKEIHIASGFKEDYQGEIVSAWISMEDPSRFPGGNVNLESRFSGDGELLSLVGQWQVVTVYINNTDTIGYFYGPQEATKQDAIDNYTNYIPSAFLKIAKIVVQGDGVGGLLESSIQILEDQRPFLSMGLSAAYYDETVVISAGASPGTVVNLPPNSRGGGTTITYKINKSQVEVYLDGVYQRAGIDFEEYQGEPFAQIRLLKEIATDSHLRFRITFKAAAVAGGIVADTLQSVYQNGPMIGLSAIYGPITMFGFDVDTILDIEGDVIIKGLLRAIDAMEFDPQSIVPGEDGTNKLFVNQLNELIYHQHHAGVSKDINILAEIESAQSAITIEVNNLSGATISADKGVALHPSLSNHVVLCDTSNALSTSRLLGVTLENIPSPGKGRIILAGNDTTTGLALPHKTVAAIDPRNPGLIVSKESITYLPDDQQMEVGIMNGGYLVVDIDRTQKKKDVWSSRVAGQGFLAGETKIVRLALLGETKGRVYTSDISFANAEEKFWAFAAVQPTQLITAGDTVDLYKEIELTPLETAFEDQDIGKSLYLDQDGNFKSWRLIRGTYSVGDAMIKIGMIENNRKIVLDGNQMMGTANGPMV